MRAEVTNLLFQNVSRFLADDATPGAPFTHLGFSTADMAAFDEATTTFAGTRITGGDIVISVETTDVTNDTVQVLATDYEPGAATIYGAGIFTTADTATLQAFHEWNTDITFEAGDEVTETLSVQSLTCAGS